MSNTYDCIVGKAINGPFFPCPSTFNFADYDRGAGDEVPPELRKRWRDWKHEHDLFLKRLPVLELRDTIHTISESHDRSSWFYVRGLEEDVRDWIYSWDRYALSFDDRDYITTAAFYARLRELRRLIDGWLYWGDWANAVVWATEKEWQRIRAKRVAAWNDELKYIYGDHWSVMKAKFERRKVEERDEQRKIWIGRESKNFSG